MALKKRVVVVGLGSIGRRHARLLLDRPDAVVEAFEPSSTSAAAARPEIGDIRLHDSFESMLRSSPDAVWISTPTPLHGEQATAALSAGVHAFCEKPMSDSLADARRICSAVDASGRLLNVGFVWHFAPALLELKRLISEGALGNIVHVHARVGTYITLVNSRSRYQMENPGSLFLDYSHQPDLFYWLLGKRPQSVQVTGIQAGQLELTSNPNVAIIVYRYNEPIVGTIHLNYLQMPQCDDYEIVGDEGWAQVSFPACTVRIGTRRDESISMRSFPHERDDIYRAEQEAFFQAMDGLRPVETSAADGLVSTALCSASIEAWRTGQEVHIQY